MTFDPFAQMNKAFETWQKLADDSLARTAAFYTEMEKLEAKNRERTESAIEESAKIAKDTFAYGATLGAEWRKLSIDAVQRGFAAFGASSGTAR